MLRRMAEQEFTGKTGTLRTKILAFVGALVLLSILGSTISLYRITEVNQLLDTINRVSVPLGKLFTQMQSDADVYARELERGLGHSHWDDPHWRARPTPQWIEDVLEGEVTRVSEMIRSESTWAPPEERARFAEWAAGISTGLRTLRADAAKLYTTLASRDMAQARAIYPRWTAEMEEWRRQVQWGAGEYERELRRTFRLAQTRAAELRTGLELVLIVVVLLSLLVLWLGERALRPLAELTGLARDIARRGLRKGDKALLPEIPLTRDDEVSALSREFHRMATALLEREKTVDLQKSRLVENNRQLKEIGELNENILLSIESVLIVTDLAGRITQCNPLAVSWLGEASGIEGTTIEQTPTDQILGTGVLEWPRLRAFFPHGYESPHVPSGKLEPRSIGSASGQTRVYGGYLMPLRSRDLQGNPSPDANGAIIVLQDLTDELDLQDRLRRAENLAAVGRMSAQVAHEVRNPLHSIGLEAEVAVELASGSSNPQLKQSLFSILSSVDRLEKITDNYLKLSRLSSGEKSEVDLGEALESVLATYASACEAQGVKVDWSREPGARLTVHGDRDLLEQVFGNLLRNALQALESEAPAAGAAPHIHWALGATDSGRVWLKIEDNGPGIPAEVRSRLFTPFVTTRAQGTGLGLSFIKQVVEDHGGTISSLDRDPAVHPGACFEMVFPQLLRAPSPMALAPPSFTAQVEAP